MNKIIKPIVCYISFKERILFIIKTTEGEKKTILLLDFELFDVV